MVARSIVVACVLAGAGGCTFLLDGGSATDAGPGDDSQPSDDGSLSDPPRCGAAVLLRDDFANREESLWETGTPSLLGFGPDGLTMEVTDSSRAQYLSTLAYDVRDSQFDIEIGVFPVNATLNLQFPTIDSQRQEGRVEIVLTSSTASIYEITDNNTNTNVVFTSPYDQIPGGRQRLWRLRHEGDQFHILTGEESGSLNAVASFPSGLNPARMRARLVLDGPGTAQIAGINMGSAAQASYCPTSDLQDDFADSLAADWDVVLNTSGGCTVDVSAGTAELTSDGTFCRLVSAKGYILGDSASVRIINDSADGTLAGWQLVHKAGDRTESMGFSLLGGTLTAQFSPSGQTQSANVPNLRPLYLRIRRISSDQIALEFSTDGANFEQVTAGATSFAPSVPMRFELSTQNPDSTALSEFDNVNLD